MSASPKAVRPARRHTLVVEPLSFGDDSGGFCALEMGTPVGVVYETMNLELLRIWSGSGKTVLFVTHNINEAVFLSDRVVVMTPRPGRIARLVEVDLPRPRQREHLKLPYFSEKVFEIRELLGVAH